MALGCSFYIIIYIGPLRRARLQFLHNNRGPLRGSRLQFLHNNIGSMRSAGLQFLDNNGGPLRSARSSAYLLTEGSSAALEAVPT